MRNEKWFARKVTCQQYSTASEATGWHTQRTKQQDLGVMSSVPPPRFARGTVMEARGSAKFDFCAKHDSNLLFKVSYISKRFVSVAKIRPVIKRGPIKFLDPTFIRVH